MSVSYGGQTHHYSEDEKGKFEEVSKKDEREKVEGGMRKT